MILTGQSPYNEISPEVLANLCRLVGFENVEWAEEIEVYRDVEVLKFFQRRLGVLLNALHNENLRTGFIEIAVELQNKAHQVGGMEIPYYRLTAQKSK